MSDKIKLVIDTDPGVDDAMAIFYSALSPEIDLLGLTTIFGNVPVEKATRNALRLAEAAGLSIPIAQGAAEPLKRTPYVHGTMVHGEEGFGDMPAEDPNGKPVSEDAADLLIRLAAEHRGELVVCAIGAITNIAEALRRNPEFARDVKRIVFMGGAAFVPGNVTQYAEANTHYDPHALTQVLACGAPIMMVGLDVTMQVMCRAEDFDAIEASSPHLGGFLNRASAFYLRFYHEVYGIDGCGLHDPAAVIACHRPELFEIKPLSIAVIEDGPEIGRTLPVPGGQAPTISVCTGGDMDAVKTLFMSAFRANATG